MQQNWNFLVSYGTYYSYLNQNSESALGTLPLAKVKIEKFKDGEISVKFEESLRGKHIFIFGETTANLTELLLTIDAARRSSVREITVVLPYYGYSRQDKRESTRGSIGAKVIAHAIESFKIDRLLSIDLHAAQIQGYVQVPFEHISGINIFKPLLDRIFESSKNNYIFVSPDAGGVSRVSKFASRWRYPIATINKIRDKPGSIASMELSGNVRDCHTVIIDDMADSCGTLSKASILLHEQGAKSIIAITTHPVMSGDVLENLEKSKINSLLVSDTLHLKYPHVDLTELSREKNLTLNDKIFTSSERIKVISCVDVLNDAILRIANEESLTDLS